MRLEKDIVPKVLPYLYYTSLGLILQLIRGMSDDIVWIVIILLIGIRFDV